MQRIPRSRLDCMSGVMDAGSLIRDVRRFAQWTFRRRQICAVLGVQRHSPKVRVSIGDARVFAPRPHIFSVRSLVVVAVRTGFAGRWNRRTRRCTERRDCVSRAFHSVLFPPSVSLTFGASISPHTRHSRHDQCSPGIPSTSPASSCFSCQS